MFYVLTERERTRLCKVCASRCVSSFQASISDARQPSMQSSVVCDNLGDLQRGQLVNSEAIQALSGTITHMTSVISMNTVNLVAVTETC
jgi:hypothetical protein